MEKATLYYNPRCSKCRGALELLEKYDVDVEIVDYMATMPERAEIVAFIQASDSEPAEFIRTGEATFAEAGIRLPADPSAGEVADALLQCPAAMQRPILVVGDRAVIGRPSERVLELIDGSEDVV